MGFNPRANRLPSSRGGSGAVLYDGLVVSSSLRIPDGTVGSPAIQFESENDGTGTGIYKPTAAQLGIAINGVLLAYFNAVNLSLTTQSSGLISGTSGDALMLRAGVNSWLFAGAVATTANTRTEINKAVTAFTDAVAKATFTITIPNGAHSASLLVRFTGSLGAGGAIGANEASATNAYEITIARTAGVNAVAAISAAFGAAAAAVAGAATVTCTAAMSAVSGAVGATNTFTIDVTITKSGGASANHTCVCTASLLNANASGVTIA